IVTAPIVDKTVKLLQVYDLHGGLRAVVRTPTKMPPPYVIAVGDFLSEHPGDEIAVAPANQNKGQASGVLLYRANGRALKGMKFVATDSGRVQLESYRLNGQSYLELYKKGSGALLQFDPEGGAHSFLQFSFEDAVDGVFRSAFGDQRYLATIANDDLSEVFTLAPGVVIERQNIGRFENEFWITVDKFGFTQEDEGEYIKFTKYAHLRADASSPAYKNPSLFSSEDPAKWEQGMRLARSGLGRLKQPLINQGRSLWEPCFTHRQFNDRFDAWKSVKDTSTGLPKYLALSRLNNVSYYGEFGAKDSFVGSTYAFGLPALDRLYELPLRGFLFALSEAHREHPERVISVEPNHEHEIAIREDQSVGDYNPAMIRGFEEYLTHLYGADLSQALAARNGPSVLKFDAPRDTGRGSWDRYDADHKFFNDWYYFNRYVVNRRLADTFTQALLAGFPAEIVKSHQIPDRYAIGTLDLFSERMTRITPIDYALTAGVGFGFTRYSVWFKKPAYALKAGYSSGFDSMVMGEYQALTSDQKLANEQLVHVWEKGGNAIHAMKWPESHDKGFNETMTQAIRNLLEKHDTPRTVVTGGVGQIKAFSNGERRFNIASLGTGADKRGLIKSLKEDGSWEGSVYAVPFRTAVSVKPIEVGMTSRIGVGNVLELSPVKSIEGGEQIVLTFMASSTMGQATLQFNVYHELGGMLPGYEQAITVGEKVKQYRFVLSAQLPADDLVVSLSVPSNVRISEASAQRETEEVARPHRDDHEGIPHQGGVSFDILP
ncbi:MAG TPA: hypothetical protein DCX06_06000, partial [Opitutae bacterium]|nr:hypothetical protein [Opitutae bacterium]